MRSSKNFHQTLKSLNFPHFKKYKTSDFDFLESNKLFNAIRECVSKFKEENVLSSEELSEFNALSKEELAALEAVEQGDGPEESVFARERNEVEFRRQYLEVEKGRHDHLRGVKELLKSQLAQLLQQKDESEKTLLAAQRRAHLRAHTLFPRVSSEWANSLRSAIAFLVTMQTTLTSPPPKSVTPELSVVQSYLAEERILSKFVLESAQNTFEFEGDGSGFIVRPPGASDSDLVREMFILLKALKTSKISKIDILGCKEKLTHLVKFYRKNPRENTIFNDSPSEVRRKLLEQRKERAQLQRKVETMKSHVIYCIENCTAIQCETVGLDRSQILLRFYKEQTDKLQMYLNIALAQRSRLEVLMAYLQLQRRMLGEVQRLAHLLILHVEEEKGAMRRRKVRYGIEKERRFQPENCDSINEFLLQSLYSILSNGETQYSVSLVLEKIVSMQQKKSDFGKKHENETAVLNSLRKQHNARRGYFAEGRACSTLLEQKREFDALFSELSLNVSVLQEKFAQDYDAYEQRRKYIELHKNREIARKLYIYALTDRDKFEGILNYTKQVVKCSVDARLPSF